MRNISNSEVTAFLTCKRMYNFAYIDNLAPKALSNALKRGTLGHLAFEYYVSARLNGSNHEAAMKAGMYAFMEAQREGSTPIDVILQTQLLFTRYMEYHRGWPEWRLLGTEERKDLPLTDTINMTIRYDLYLEIIATGQRALLDFKFSYDFWSPHDHEVNGQMPKYISVMNLNNERVDIGFLEEIRTRQLGKDKASDPKNLWKRSVYNPNIHRKREMLKQHVSASLAIERHRGLDPDTRDEESIPVLNKFGACKYCNFADLCNSMNDGERDLRVAKDSGYEQNTYGYNPVDQLGELL